MPSLQCLSKQKRLLRKAVSACLGRVPTASIDAQSNEIARRIQAIPEFKTAGGISCYLSMPLNEVATGPITTHVLSQSGKRLFVPKITSKENSLMDCFEIYSEEDLESLPSGTWGIKEPDPLYDGKARANALEEQTEQLDVILLPAVAYDRSFSRLGHGKGYYDRFIAAYTSRGRRRPLLVGLSLREQLLESGAIPMSDFDWKVDVVVTPDEILVREKERGESTTQ